MALTATGRASRWAERRPVARPQRAVWGRPLATSTPGQGRRRDAVCNTHEAMAQAAISQFIESDRLQEYLTNPVTEMRPTGVLEHTQQVRTKTTREEVLLASTWSRKQATALMFHRRITKTPHK